MVSPEVSLHIRPILAAARFINPAGPLRCVLEIQETRLGARAACVCVPRQYAERPALATWGDDASPEFPTVGVDAGGPGSAVCTAGTRVERRP